MPKQRAYVYKETKGIDSYRVFPPVVVLGQGDQFELVNLSGDPAALTVKAGVFGGAVQQNIPHGQGSGIKVAGNAAIAAEYKVVVKGKDAQGNSDPVIIIDL